MSRGSACPASNHITEDDRSFREKVRKPRMLKKKKKKAYSGFEKKDRKKKQTLKKSKMTLRARRSQLTAAKLLSGHNEDMAHMKSQQVQLPAKG